MVRPEYLDAIEAEFASVLGAKAVAYTEKVTLLVSHKDRYGSDVANVAEWIARAEEVLARIGGGATSLRAHGVWLGQRVQPLHEDTTLVYTYAPPNKILLHIPSIRKFVLEYGARTQQEEVALLLESAEGDWFFRIPIKSITNGEA